MKISIVTLSFNQRQYLGQAIESIVGQEYPALDYIVVDPGSTDGSRELADSYGSRVAKRNFLKDAGPADGLNRGFQLASGNIFGFVNADDYLLPGCLSVVSKHFADNQDCDILLGDGYLVDGAGSKMRHLQARGFTIDRYLHGGAVWLQQSTFFRRELFETVGGFNIENRVSWDGELFMDMLTAGARVQYLSRDLACFRMHGESISHRIKHVSNSPDVVRFRGEATRLFKKYAGREWGLRDDIARRYYQVEKAFFQPSALLSKIRNA